VKRERVFRKTKRKPNQEETQTMFTFTTITKLTALTAALLSLTLPSLAQEKSAAATKLNAPKAAPMSASVKKSEAKKPGSKKVFEGTLSLNKASASALESLPGIGPATAARIIEYRTAQGKFRDISELMEVKGIGEKKLAQLRPHLTLD
jgi:competence protein ComEA